MKQERGRGWAYANSVERISENQLSFKHYTNSETAKDVSIYLDALIYEDSFKVGRRKILRVGGPRPLWRLHGGDVIQRNAFLQQFDGLRSEEHTSELQSRGHLVCRLLLEKNK